MRAKFVLSEVAVGLFRNVMMTIAMIITTAVSLTSLGVGGLVIDQVGKMEDYFYFRLEVSIFLDKNVTTDQRQTLRDQLAEDPLVREIFYEDKNQAYQRFREQFKDSPDLVANVQPEALPESFRVKLKDPTKFEAAATKYADAPGVDQVTDQRKLVGKLFSVLNRIRNTAFVIAIAQGIAALLLIANTIQVAAYSRRREVGIMKLVGAPNWYIQLPFVIEAAVAGLVGALLAWGVIIGAKLLFVDPVLGDVFTGVIPSWEWQQVLLAGPILAGIAIVLSAVVGWITLRFQIKV